MNHPVQANSRTKIKDEYEHLIYKIKIKPSESAIANNCNCKTVTNFSAIDHFRYRYGLISAIKSGNCLTTLMSVSVLSALYTWYGKGSDYHLRKRCSFGLPYALC